MRWSSRPASRRRSRHVVDYAEIASRGVLSTPGLVIDGSVVLAGRVPTREQVAEWLGVS